MSANEVDLSFLDAARNVNYGREDLPSDKDGRIRDLLLGLSTPVLIERSVRRMPQGAGQVLNAFAERAASIAVRHQDAREIRAGLLAAAISGILIDDVRESTAPLSLLYRAAEMIGNDPDAEFAAVGALVGDGSADLSNFLRRSTADKSIEAMGYVEGDDRRGFRFIRNW